LQDIAETHGIETATRGMVFKKSLGEYGVDVQGRIVPCSLSNKLHKQLVYPTAHPSSVRHRVVKVTGIKVVDPVAIGDMVTLVEAGDGTGMITEVLPRKSTLVRRAAGAKPLKQVMAANVDQVLAVMAAARPAPSWELMDRYLAAAEEAKIPALIVITKLDLVDPASLQDEVQSYREIGYTVILTSAETGLGMVQLKAELRGCLSVIAGKSGVGKTSLLNRLQPGLGLRVKEIGAKTGKGKHSTTQLEMFPLDFGGALIDTPGVREFGLWDVDATELAQLFPDLRPYLGECRFGLSCSHAHEPGCAIKQAVEAGKITPRRYQSYLRMTG
jgi:ribosome biogenesis GTPase / thiamine phosphate phosphatase